MSPRPQEPPRPSPLELRILNEIYRLGSASPSELLVIPAIGSGRHYQTLVTLCNRLKVKGFLRTSRFGRDITYSPVYSQEEVLRPAIEEFLDSAVGDNPEAFDLLLKILEERSTAQASRRSGAIKA